MRKDGMTNRQCIKCGEKGHIESDCTKGWKPPVTQCKGKGKAEVKVVAAKMSAIKVTEDVGPASLPFSQWSEEDELDCSRIDSRCGLS